MFPHRRPKVRRHPAQYQRDLSLLDASGLDGLARDFSVDLHRGCSYVNFWVMEFALPHQRETALTDSELMTPANASTFLQEFFVPELLEYFER